MRRYDEIRGAGTRIFPDGKVKYGGDVYVYSTSWRLTVPPFCFYPWTTIAPINRDFSKAVSFRWNPSERRIVRIFIHPTVVRTAREWGLEVLYKMALLCFARGTRQPALVELAHHYARHNQSFRSLGWLDG